MGRTEYQHDVEYEVWRMGGNVDGVEAEIYYYDGIDSFDAARIEVKRQARVENNLEIIGNIYENPDLEQ